MKLSQIGEFGLIRRIRRATPKGRGVLLGIGDDAAWVESKTGSLLVTSDLLLEDIHFNLKWTSLFALGHKSLAVNLSDIAAMGGIPRYLVLSLGIPPRFGIKGIDEFYQGVRSLASKSGVALIGGDTNAAASLLISACVIGQPVNRPITRSGAKVGDDIFVTGTLGDSGLGLHLLCTKQLSKSRAIDYLISRHHLPAPRLKAAKLLADAKLAKAMIDISDGLVQDLRHVCRASKVGAIIEAERLPLSAAYQSMAGRHGSRYALSGGEDYELLFCARRKDRSRLEDLERSLDVPITRIGRCVQPSHGIKVLNYGKPLRPTAQGHDHFGRS